MAYIKRDDKMQFFSYPLFFGIFKLLASSLNPLPHFVNPKIVRGKD